ncbi:MULTISPECIES: hypothetical protein [unclassified Nocardioides]|uniref:hypothetical protein n=1 Tax=unclassified Nocardioides TaxID=2615069 RepID=UPI0036084843
MTEEQIKDGFDRLESALGAPRDARARVAHRIAVRRRRRRAVVAGGAALGVALVGGIVASALSGDDGSDQTVAVDPPSGPLSTLVMTRPDGSTYAFPDVTVSCEPPVGTEGDTQGTDARIWMTSPMPADVASDDAELERPFVYFEGRLDKLTEDRTFRLPVWGPGDSSTYPLVLFMADPSDGERANEVASSAGGSGTVRVLRASCDPVPVLELDVDATLDSEVEQESLKVAGALR